MNGWQDFTGQMQMQTIIDSLESAEKGIIQLQQENLQLRAALQYFIDEVIENEDGHDNLLRAADIATEALKSYETPPTR